jgi:hypothetical protein
MFLDVLGKTRMRDVLDFDLQFSFGSFRCKGIIQKKIQFQSIYRKFTFVLSIHCLRYSFVVGIGELFSHQVSLVLPLIFFPLKTKLTEIDFFRSLFESAGWITSSENWILSAFIYWGSITYSTQQTLPSFSNVTTRIFIH